MPAFRVALVDVDGCLTSGEGQPLEFEVLSHIANMNRRAREDRSLPAITLCTGRPAPYVELLQQAIDGFLPAIFESGCGLFIPEPYGFKPHPLLTEDVLDGFRAGMDRLRQRLVRPGQAFFQLGKEYSASLYPVGISLDELVSATCDLLGEAFCIERAVHCINVTHAGLDKAAGTDWLAAEIGISPADMLAIGDSDVDLSMMARAGLSAAPANARPEVQARAAYVSPYPTSQGVLDILRHFTENS